MFGYVCGSDNVHILSVFKHGYTVVLLLLLSLILYSHRVALSEVDVLWNCLYSARECQSPAVNAGPRPGWRQLLFSLASWNLQHTGDGGGEGGRW